jgi:hypothetical protein
MLREPPVNFFDVFTPQVLQIIYEVIVAVDTVEELVKVVKAHIDGLLTPSAVDGDEQGHHAVGFTSSSERRVGTSAEVLQVGYVAPATPLGNVLKIGGCVCIFIHRGPARRTNPPLSGAGQTLEFTYMGGLARVGGISESGQVLSRAWIHPYRNHSIII